MRTPDPSRPLPFDEARRLAAVHGWREKVLVYVTRNGTDLLVLEHTAEYPGAGVQVPAGGVEPGESPGDAAPRELFEETGLGCEGPAEYLVSHLWIGEAPSRIRHYYWLAVPSATPDTWTHVVSAGEEDAGMAFTLSFRPLDDVGLTPGYGWDAALGHLHHVLSVDPELADTEAAGAAPAHQGN